jgi:hypothetical protein
MQKTLVAEFDNSSDTATYMDNINPYTFNTRDVFIDAPYTQYIQTQAGKTNALELFKSESADVQSQQLKEASDLYAEEGTGAKVQSTPVLDIVSSLIDMARAGLYEPALAGINSGNGHADESTYVTRFLADTGVLEEKASSLNITTEQYGMVREATGHAPGAWWLTPIGLLNHSVLKDDDNGDRDAAIIFGSLLLTMLAFPFIPYVNQLPDKLKVYKLIWHEKKK